jgi:hypothetical protein
LIKIFNLLAIDWTINYNVKATGHDIKLETINYNVKATGRDIKLETINYNVKATGHDIKLETINYNVKATITDSLNSWFESSTKFIQIKQIGNIIAVSL